MSTTVAPAAPTTSATPEPVETPWRRFVQYLVRRRVRISVVVFIALVVEDALEPLRPHAVTDLGDLKSMLGLGLVLGGLAIRSWAAGILHKQSQLTTSGPYSLVRHPLYVGSFMMMLGFCALIDDAENIWFVLGPFVGLYLLGILSEERTLGQRFGTRWRDYAKSVPRFLPRRLPHEMFSSWTMGQWLKNREYRAVGAALAGLAAIQIWHTL